MKNYVESKTANPVTKLEFENLAKEKNKLFLSGVASNICAIILPFVKLFIGDGQLGKIIKSIVGELSNDLVGYFLSMRRHLNGIFARLKFKRDKSQD